MGVNIKVIEISVEEPVKKKPFTDNICALELAKSYCLDFINTGSKRFILKHKKMLRRKDAEVVLHHFKNKHLYHDKESF